MRDVSRKNIAGRHGEVLQRPVFLIDEFDAGKQGVLILGIRF
jgi:hypothetical protein